MNNSEMILVYTAIAILMVVSMTYSSNRSRRILQEWADENGYQLLNAKYAYFFKGPFFWTSSKSQTVYRVQVRDADGRTRNGWLRCGSWMLGLWSNQTQVRWDDE